MFVTHVCPPKLKCHCDLELWPRKPKFNKCHLLVMTNHYTKLEDDPWAMSSLVIDRTRFVYGWTDQQTCAKQYTPTSLKGAIILNTKMTIIRYYKSCHRHTPTDGACWERGIASFLDTSSWYAEYLCHINLKSCNE